jgi:16S rRNA (adenine1518-N6/adenine1519-N6)-dimethyltransferase
MADDPRAILRSHGLTAKKSFGQCFLVDPNIVRKIADACVPDAEIGRASVVEIGAGTGALTSALLPRAKKLVAIERDRDLVIVLRDLFPEPNVDVIEGDAQTVPIAFAGHHPAVLCGNLPYQLTGRLLRRAVESVEIDRAVFMVQLEVCERLLAAAGSKEYGALTVFVRAALNVERVMTVGRGAFHPQPDVTSAVVRLIPRPDRIPETPTFRALVKGAFATRRKTLRNAWSGVAAKSDLERAATASSISLDARGETLSVEAFARMASALET